MQRCSRHWPHSNSRRPASTLEIGTRARVSKRDLYALVGTKQEMLIACISERARRLVVPADLPVLRDRETLAQVLASFGTKLVREISDPAVIAVFRLAIAEAVQAPEVARSLDSIGRETSRAALRKIMAQAQESGLLTGRPAELAQQSPGCSGAICWSACCSGLPSDRTLAKSRNVPAMPQPPSCNFMRYRRNMCLNRRR